jgi:hypothetical protein
MLGVVGRALVEVRGATYAMYPKVVMEEDNPQPVAAEPASAYDTGERSFVARQEYSQQIGQVGVELSTAAVQPARADYAYTYGDRGANNVTQLPQQPAGAGTIPGEGLVFGQPAAEPTAPQQPTGPTDVRDIALRASEQAAAIQAAQMSVENAHREAA